jgi:hypothetical protein
VTGEVVELEAALEAGVELEVAVEVGVELEATLKAGVELDNTGLDAAELDAGEDDDGTLVGVSVVELEGVVVGAELDAIVEVVEVVATLVGVDKVVVYNICVEVA